MHRFLEWTYAELLRARSKHGAMNSLHEGYAVILEELDEFWDQVKRQSEARDPNEILLELVQIAAMAMKTALDCGTIKDIEVQRVINDRYGMITLEPPSYTDNDSGGQLE